MFVVTIGMFLADNIQVTGASTFKISKEMHDRQRVWWDNSEHYRMRGLYRLDRCYIKKRLWIGFLLMQRARCLSPRDTVKADIIAQPMPVLSRVWRDWSARHGDCRPRHPPIEFSQLLATPD